MALHVDQKHSDAVVHGGRDLAWGLSRRDFMLYGTGLLLCGCATAPITGRTQLMLVSESEETALGVQAYREILQKEPVTRDSQYTEPVQRIARRLEAAANRPDLRWEVSVIEEDETVNAFALPGGKIGVYKIGRAHV